MSSFVKGIALSLAFTAGTIGSACAQATDGPVLSGEFDTLVGNDYITSHGLVATTHVVALQTQGAATLTFPGGIAVTGGVWTDFNCEKLGFIPGDRETFMLAPSPHEDFYGAGFLYFAAFQAMVDRAEWQWFRPVKPVLQTSFRQIRYLGNVEPEENVQAKLIQYRQAETSLEHLVSLHRATDDFEIARRHTRREPCIDPTVGAAN